MKLQLTFLFSSLIILSEAHADKSSKKWDKVLRNHTSEEAPDGIGGMLDEEVKYQRENEAKLRELAQKCLGETCSRRISPNATSQLKPDDRRPTMDSFVLHDGKTMPFDPKQVQTAANGTKSVKVYWSKDANNQFVPSAERPVGKAYHVMTWRFGKQVTPPADGQIRKDQGKLVNVESYQPSREASAPSGKGGKAAQAGLALSEDRRYEATVKDLLNDLKAWGQPSASVPLDNSEHTARRLAFEPDEEDPGDDNFVYRTQRDRQWKPEDNRSIRDGVWVRNADPIHAK